MAAGWAGRIIVIALAVWFVLLPLLRGDRPDVSLMLITVLVGSFLWMGASASIQHGRLRGRLHLGQRRGAGRTRRRDAGVRHRGGNSPACAFRAPRPSFCADRMAGRRGSLTRPPSPPFPSEPQRTTPATAVSHALGAGAYVPEWSQGQELVQYLAQLEGARVRRGGSPRQGDRPAPAGQAVVTAITGKEMRRSGRASAQNR